MTKQSPKAEKPRGGKRTHLARLGSLPVDLTMEDGQVVTIEAPATGRFHVLVTTPKPAKAKRRKPP